MRLKEDILKLTFLNVNFMFMTSNTNTLCLNFNFLYHEVVKRDPISGLGDLPKEHCEFGRPKTAHQNRKGRQKIHFTYANNFLEYFIFSFKHLILLNACDSELRH